MFRVFNDVYGHFIEGFECLFVVGSERFHALFLVEADRFRRDFEVEPALMDDAEKCSALVESIPAEHRAAGDAAQIGQLIQHVVFESVMLRCHAVASQRLVCRDHSDGKRKGDAVATLVLGGSLSDEPPHLLYLGNREFGHKILYRRRDFHEAREILLG